jgi:photosystem II stability/assembly factor-like uncharacterized protein
MNLRILYLLILLPIFADGQEGNFKWQNPLPQGNDLNGVSCASGRYAWAAGQAGTIIKSTDKGVNWEIQYSGVTNQLNGVSFTDSLTGWVCGNSVILHTGDGGETWIQQAIPVVPSINDIMFIDHELGWAVCGSGHILRSIDGGANWLITNIDILSTFWAVHFIDSQTGFVSGSNGAFLKTVDGGATWQLSTFFDSDYWLRSVFFTSQDTGFMSGLLYDWVFSDPIIVKTTDGGLTWTTTFPGSPAGHSIPWDIYFTDPMNGFIAGDNSVVYQTIDGGESWTDRMWDDYHDMYSLAFFDDDYALCVGSEAQIMRKLGGPFFIWKLNESGPTKWIDDIVFTDEQTGWAVGSENTLLSTNNGGTTWMEYEFGDADYNSWYSITFPDRQHGWIAGIYGDLIHTSNGGLTWNYQETLTNKTIYSVFFIDENYGWAVGEDDLRIRTTDGGETWFGAPSFMWEYTNDVFFLDHLTGWVAGGGFTGGYVGFINKTVNGGGSWVMQYPNTSSELSGIFFTDEHNGWAVGENSTMLHSIDGGSNWQSVENNANTDLTDVFFINSQEGWITGYDGAILHTFDGGDSWILEPQITDNYFESVFFLDQDHGWICGEDGTILTFNPDAPVEVNEMAEKSRTTSLHIFPNPCNSFVTIRPGAEYPEKISIYDLAGKRIKDWNINFKKTSNEDFILDLTDLPPGIYLVEAKSRESIVIEKIIVF